MNHTPQSGRRQFIAQGGVAAFAALALGAVARTEIAAQDGTPETTLPTVGPATADAPLYATPAAGSPGGSKMCTIGRWHNGAIAEEYIFFDLPGQRPA